MFIDLQLYPTHISISGKPGQWIASNQLFLKHKGESKIYVLTTITNGAKKLSCMILNIHFGLNNINIQLPITLLYAKSRKFKTNHAPHSTDELRRQTFGTYSFSFNYVCTAHIRQL